MERSLTVRNIIWVVLVLSCLAMTLHECVTIIMTYFGYPILHQRQFVYNNSLAFPAVTLCSNNPANRLLFSNPDNPILEKIHYFQNNGPLPRQFVMKEEPRYALLDALYNISEAERLSLSTSLRSIKLTCTFGYRGCIHKWYISNTLYNGNCFTFNHVTNPEEGLQVNDLIELTFAFMNELVERVPNLKSRPTFSMAIHPVGTAPVLHPSHIIEVAPGDNVVVSVTQSIVTRLPSPYKSHCVNSDDLSVKNTTVYYRPYKEYIYSVEACLMSCIQRLRMEHCKCVEPTIPVASFLTELHGEKLPLCTSSPGASSCYIALVNEARCNCPLPCKETKLNFEVYTGSIANEDSIIAHYNKLIPIRFPLGSEARKLNYSDKLRTVNYQRTLRSYVTIRFKSTTYEKISEQPKLTLSDFLGFIGGNVGLWLGMSVLSIFDVGKYAWQKANRLWQLYQKKKSNIFPISLKRNGITKVKSIRY